MRCTPQRLPGWRRGSRRAAPDRARSTGAPRRLRGEERRSDDAGLVQQRRRRQRRLDVDEVEEAVSVLADAAADDEEVGREELLELRVVAGQAPGPVLECEPFSL